MRRLKQLRTYEVALDKAGLGPVAGIDEAGRGACFGPITIAACILPSRPLRGLEELTDSKKLTPKKRDLLFDEVVSSATAYSVVHISAGEIDRRGIQNANLDGARRAISELAVEPGFVLVDAFRVPGLTIPQLPIVGGDYTARCIAAASILAKVSRDRLVTQMAEEFPEYGLEGHKGYGTQAHMDAVRRHGASPEHRYTYANVAAAHQTYVRSTKP
ncbi:ribonuclease HII [Corynebacterium meitnerae]|uniref:Ribonuclease HII n=1 Tax=Corynebacterium meitnerae TaxID=2913498 RepID=A0A9X3LTH6_9CORY|nr:ribonuclease HII [Corynebacterium meitnerae]MCZ9293324.1 ribonuclease HII [Corynebacterium meitnerae]